MTKVVHFKKEKYDVYIGRPSRWGNPFSHKEGTLAEFKTGSRKEAVEKFEEYLISNKDLMKDLPSLKGKVLGCWCKPQLCHGDILAKYADMVEPLF
jgi:hypothetical protein